MPIKVVEKMETWQREGPHHRQDRDAAIPGGKLQARDKDDVVQRVTAHKES